MKRLLKMEYYRLFRNKMTYIALIVGLVIATLQVVYESLPFWQVNKVIPSYPLTVFEKWIGGDRASIFPTLYFLLMPLLTALPYGGALQEDIRTGRIRNVCTRVKKKKYFCAKYIVAFSMGILPAVPLIWNFLLTAVIFPAMLPQACLGVYSINSASLLGDLFYVHPYVYLCIWLLLDIFFFGLLATLSLAVFPVTNYVYVAVITPFLICIVLYGVTWISTYRLFAPFYFLQPCQPNPANPGAIALEVFLMLAVGAAYRYMGNRKEIF